jgi:hypothetical protein
VVVIVWALVALADISVLSWLFYRRRDARLRRDGDRSDQTPFLAKQPTEE